MSGELKREDGGVDDADVGRSVDDKLGVDDTTLLERKHSTSRRRVELGPDIVCEPSVPVVVCRYRRAGCGLTSQLAAERSSSGERPNELGTRTKDVHVYCEQVSDDVHACTKR